MSIELFKAVFGRIEIVEADRMTDKSVWIRGRKNSIKSSYESYHLTYKEAKQSLVEDAKKKLLSVQYNLKYAQDALAKAENL